MRTMHSLFRTVAIPLTERLGCQQYSAKLEIMKLYSDGVITRTTFRATLHYIGPFVVQSGVVQKEQVLHKLLFVQDLRKRVIGIEPTTFSFGTGKTLNVATVGFSILVQ